MKKYVLAYKNVKTTPVIPECGYVVSNSIYPELNGTYIDVTIPGINKSDYTYIEQYIEEIINQLVSEGKLDSRFVGIANYDYFRITTNNTCYIIEGNFGGIITKHDSSYGKDWYYNWGGGAEDITNMDLDYASYNVSPGITASPQYSSDWENHTFPTIVEYGEYLY